MAIVGLASAHGSPGVTTLSTALAHHLPGLTGRASLLLEADPDGGVIGLRHDLAGVSGLIDLAGAARSGIHADDVVRFAAPLPSGVLAIVGHPAAEQAHAALRAGAGHLAAALTDLDDHDTVIDLGRLRPGSPAQPLAAICDVLLIITRPAVEQIVAVADRLTTFGSIAPVQIVLVGDRPYGAVEVRRVLQLDLVHVVADDRSAALADPAAATPRKRSGWARSVAALASRLARGLEQAPAPAATEVAGDGISAIPISIATDGLELVGGDR